MLIQLYLDSYSYKKILGTLVPYCKKCCSDNLVKDGKYKSFQQYRCKDCGFRFSFTSDLPKRRFHSEIIEFAVNMYVTTGISLRKLAQKIWNFFKTKVSYKTIERWVRSFHRRELDIEVGNVWHADETYIKVAGNGHWLWIVMDRDTRTVISWHLSKTRAIEDAKKLMLEAKKKAGTPKKIITDGLFEYIKAIRKTFGWRAKVHSRHVRGAFGPNSLIERLNREIKRRYKWFGTFQSEEGAKNFIKQWINNYNTEKVT